MPQLRFFYAAESRGDSSQRVTRFASLRARDTYVEAHCLSACRITAAEAATIIKLRGLDSSIVNEDGQIVLVPERTPLVRR